MSSNHSAVSEAYGHRTTIDGQYQRPNQRFDVNRGLVIEAFRDLVKDELKAHIRNKVEDDPELKAEIKEAVSYYFQSKARSIYAELKATRAATRLGLRLLPDDLQGEVGEALVSLFEKELEDTLRKSTLRINFGTIKHPLLSHLTE